jgi:hypothetical protein
MIFYKAYATYFNKGNKLALRCRLVPDYINGGLIVFYLTFKVVSGKEFSRKGQSLLNPGGSPFEGGSPCHLIGNGKTTFCLLIG